MTYRVNPNEISVLSLGVIYDMDLREIRDTPDEGYFTNLTGSEISVPIGFPAVREDQWKSALPSIRQLLIDAFHDVNGRSDHDAVYEATHLAEEALYGYAMKNFLLPEVFECIESEYITRLEDEEERLLRVEITMLNTTRIIDASTSDDALKTIADELEDDLSMENILLLDAEERLKALRDDIRDDDPEWGPLTPYLEALLKEGHPALRRKKPGPYNPEGKRTILIATGITRGDQGNWSPAILEESDAALKQWDDAGLDYPMIKEANQRRRQQMIRELPGREDQRRERAKLPDINKQRGIIKDIRKQMARLNDEIALLLESNNTTLDTSLTAISGMMRSRHTRPLDHQELHRHAMLRITTALSHVKEALDTPGHRATEPMLNSTQEALAYLKKQEVSEALAPHIQRMIKLIERFDHDSQATAA